MATTRTVSIPKKKQREEFVSNITDELRIRFNQFCTTELGFDIDEQTERLYDLDTDELVVINEKFIKDYEGEYSDIRYYANDTKLLLLDNAGLLTALFMIYLGKFNGTMDVLTFQHSTSTKGDSGKFSCTIKGVNGINEIIESDSFMNESVRIFNIICKINKTVMRYNFKEFDVL